MYRKSSLFLGKPARFVLAFKARYTGLQEQREDGLPLCQASHRRPHRLSGYGRSYVGFANAANGGGYDLGSVRAEGSDSQGAVSPARYR
jgi:hypothetical protein